MRRKVISGGSLSNAHRTSRRYAQSSCEALETRRLLALVVPSLSSLPGAPVTFYLDFDGSPAANWAGKLSHGPAGNNDPIPAFSMDGDVANFSNAELSMINNLWSYVSEKYCLFNINVTTVSPGAYSDFQSFGIVVGGSVNDWYTGNAGGVARRSGFSLTGEPNYGFVWSGDVSTASTANFQHYVGESIAHEGGHLLGLRHQSDVDSFGNVNVEYSNGNATDAPIMGNSGNQQSKRGIWWNGKSSERDSNNNLVYTGLQDDLSVITGFANQTVGARVDDHSVSSNMTVNSNGTIVPVTGIIENLADQDSWLFVAPGTSGTFYINNNPFGGMLASTGRIVRTSDGSLPAITVSTSNINQTVISTSSLVPGASYRFDVQTQGFYGELGSYTVTAALATSSSLNPTTKKLTINGFAGNDTIVIATGLNDMVLVTDNGGQTSYAKSSVDSIDVLLDNSHDDVTVNSLFKTDGVTAMPIWVSLGGGTSDILRLQDPNANQCDWDIQAYSVVWTISGTHQMHVDYFNAETLEIDGNNQVDHFNVNGLGPDTVLHCYGSGSNDTMNLFPGVDSTTGGDIFFHGGVGSDLLDISATDLSQTNRQVLNGSVHMYGGGNSFSRYANFDPDVEQLTLRGANYADVFDIDGLASTMSAVVFGSFGNDLLNIGYDDGHGTGAAWSTYIRGPVTFLPGSGNDSITIDDADYPSGSLVTYNMTTSTVSGVTSLTSSAGGGQISIGSDTENYTFLSRFVGNSQLNVTGLNNPAHFRFYGFTSSASSDTLVVDDRAMSSPPILVNIAANSFTRYFLANPGVGQVMDFFGWESPYYEANTSASNNIHVYGTSTDITSGHQMTIYGGGNNDSLTLHPHDAAGNRTINGVLQLYADLGGSGSNDTITIDDLASSAGINYQLLNTFVASNQNIYGMGSSFVGFYSDFEHCVINAGAGNDSFSVDQYTSGIGLTINAGNGDDTCTIGNGDMSANITNIATFTFDGQNGSDRFNITNGATNTPWNYQTFNNRVDLFRPSTGYFIQLVTANIESQYFFAGSVADGFYVDAVATGLYTECNGAAGIDSLTFGFSTSSVDSVLGPIVYNAQNDGGIISIADTADTTADILHVTASTLGAFSGDTFFGAGGSLQFGNLVNSGSTPGITINLGSGGDTVYAQPLASARVTINAGNPTTSPGDSMNLALAGVTSPGLNNTGGGSGNLTSTNRQTLNWTGIESGPNTDAVSPAAQSEVFNVNGILSGGVRRQVVDVQFSENVALLSGSASIQLTNLTSGQTILPAAISLSYDASTKTAHFTFPGYFNGVLPDGDYFGTVLADRTADTFGNPLTADVHFGFFVLAADANRDRSVDTVDFNILAASFSQIGKTFSQGDFNYDGAVDTVDFNLLAANFSNSLPAPSAAMSAVPQLLEPPPAGAGRSIFSDRAIDGHSDLVQALEGISPA